MVDVNKSTVSKSKSDSSQPLSESVPKVFFVLLGAGALLRLIGGRIGGFDSLSGHAFNELVDGSGWEQHLGGLVSVTGSLFSLAAFGFLVVVGIRGVIRGYRGDS